MKPTMSPGKYRMVEQDAECFTFFLFYKSKPSLNHKSWPKSAFHPMLPNERKYLLTSGKLYLLLQKKAVV